MPWNDIARRDYARRALRYASDLTDREWALIAPFLPSPRPIGRPRTTDLREVANAILYMAATGCQWRMLPKEPAADLDGATLLLRLARPRAVADDQQSSGDGGARAGGPGGKSDGGHH